MKTVSRSHKLDNVCYDIRGPIAAQARKMEDEGHRILKLNIGNPAPFGFEAPDDIVKDVIHNLPTSQGYSDSTGIYAARVAVMQYYQQRNIKDIRVDDVYIGNGVSELIMMAMQALLNHGDEVLIPSPDYPLWTAAVSLSSGSPVHYRCDEQAGWFPDIDDIKSKITSKTRAIVLINPNNPTGAVYDKALLQEVVEVAREHGLVVFSDEIYDKILYDEAKHTSIASLADDVFFVTFGGLSKNYRVAGFRSGWLVVSGNKRLASDYIEGLNILSSMRMCANVPCQSAIQTALGGYQSIDDLVKENGRLRIQRDVTTDMLNGIDGISCVKPKGAMYCFAKVDEKKFNIQNDEQMVLDLLSSEKILLVHGRAFNLTEGTYFRLVFLPHSDVLVPALHRIGNFFRTYKQGA
ncbi:pyridoxal phosphate-dependent aminotransferase [Alteromonas macleodii]|jgi:alanine-synthesizing transaminase|uniref:Glutamate-pyruvate aminotransferase AlaA n=3 Tax=Alteromonas TaxID=226 RepID=A0A126Q0P3_ALTMA|nr:MULTISPECIES: pyridoxal phosphate-dependent aminotransferase [Alteromonas]AFT78687.1 aminotransferase AlaT [Alteromonas macleodii str. 'Black Sea 11']MEE3223002.1 pyridoxal phosphate-dependent aminotransferase [Pseudomonadota bacterium]NKX18346.1 pyridoxal phosphate-dependent aminotransferase [Alteromonadaceae bacterium A_SAG5]NKX35405.1 pyridoxal phosphate-dependent aminotransferase [Alteromonadaceae bacterium A_SAG3]AMJ98755.1 aminotransferase [Alteromonas macleodii]|tara:strand:+ start:135 stop:1355 length:1221 start_codon:yes stop_codon:yes gene_type:complete